MTIRAVASVPILCDYEVGGPKQTFFGKPRTKLPSVFVRVETASGHVGWGEGFGISLWPVTRCVIDEVIAPVVMGRDEDDVPGLMHALQHPLHVFGRGGPVAFALSALDIALWDIAAKKAGKPLSDLLGGARHARLPAYASLMRYGSPEVVARNCERAVAQGYRAIKLHETSLDCIRAAREAAGPQIELTVDANCAWTFDQAEALLPEFERLDLHWLEEPTWPPEDHRQLARLARRTSIPLAAGENAVSAWEIAELAGSGAVAVIQPSVTKIGGVSEMLRILATSTGSPRIVPHSPYLGPGFIASLHLCSTLAPATPVERLFCEIDDHPLGQRIAVSDGYVEIPSGPGLGADPDPAALEAAAVRA